MAFEIPQPHPHHKQHLSIGVALTALTLAVAFHYLFAEVPYGFSFAVFVALLVAGLHMVIALTGRGGNTWAYLFLIPVVLGVVAESLLASWAVRLLTPVLVAVSLAFFSYWRTHPAIPFWEVKSLWPSALITETIFPIHGLEEFFSGLRVGKNWFRALIGAVVALPFLIVIGSLFSGADPLLRQTLSDLLNFERLPEFTWKFFRDLIAFFFFLGLGWGMLSRALTGRRPVLRERGEPVDRVIYGTFLAVINILFGLFLAFQFIYFFGGESLVAVRGLTYAEYARSGFFELLWVAIIVFLIAWVIYRNTEMREWLSRGLTLLLILQTGVVIVSATMRLLLYINAYGLSVSRWWAAAVILLISAVLLGLALGTLSKRGFAFIAKTLFLGILFVLSGLLLVNVEGWVVKTNVDRFLSGQTKKLDLFYLEDLSSDAIPALVSLYQKPWPSESPEGRHEGEGRALTSRQELANSLRDSSDRIIKMVYADWRRATIADYRAVAAASSVPEQVKVNNLPQAKASPFNPILGVPAGEVPERYEGNIILDGKPITDLRGLLPREVIGNVSLQNTGISSLVGLPQTITGDLDLQGNNLTSLAGIPETIGGNLNLSRNPLQSLAGLPRSIGGTSFYLYDIPAKTIPPGTNIGYVINVNSWQVELIQDAKAKGYPVYVAPKSAI